MNWASVKNLLIVMLLAANIFLIYNISVQDRTKSYISEAELRDAALLLSERGQEIELSGIPQKRFSADIYESLYPGDEDYIISTASMLTGTDQSGLRIYPMPDGSTRVSTGSSGGRFKNMEFTKDFSFSYWIGGNQSDGAYTDITADVLDEREGLEELGKTRLAALSKLALAFLGASDQDESGLTAHIEGGYSDPERGVSYLLVSQRLGGIEVFRHRVVCVFEGEELAAASGRWYFEDIGSGYDYDLYDQVSILFTNYKNLSAKQESAPLPKVTSMSSCYSTYMNPDKTALYFIPAWQVDHSDGLIEVYNAARSTEYYSSD